MPASTTIYPEWNLVLVRYSDYLLTIETAQNFEKYLNHRDFRINQRGLFDLNRVTGAQMDLVKMRELQKYRMQKIAPSGDPVRLVLFAQTDFGCTFARLIAKTWEPSGAEVSIVEDSEASALAELEIPLDDFATMVQQDNCPSAAG
ncbi:hypothetical protein TL5118_01357 [Thalassovita autumnalis]|uniref:Uncharacterized protein n=1 Tax=Thalassovita autumnalis TaxID=2072972 RepID=A0A0P1FBL8_9RHOB|nr:hypothetical protein [Thalassovita autumnalis]CUH65555.1 hypothetical protein TL5118_01357 [Thalassovita autumnalis]CUH70561.1 hypothetical protein TL5120_00338 [Thalassovita autumnalis]